MQIGNAPFGPKSQMRDWAANSSRIPVGDCSGSAKSHRYLINLLRGGLQKSEWPYEGLTLFLTPDPRVDKILPQFFANPIVPSPATVRHVGGLLFLARLVYSLPTNPATYRQPSQATHASFAIYWAAWLRCLLIHTSLGFLRHVDHFTLSPSNRPMFLSSHVANHQAIPNKMCCILYMAFHPQQRVKTHFRIVIKYTCLPHAYFQHNWMCSHLIAHSLRATLMISTTILFLNAPWTVVRHSPSRQRKHLPKRSNPNPTSKDIPSSN